MQHYNTREPLYCVASMISQSECCYKAVQDNQDRWVKEFLLFIAGPLQGGFASSHNTQYTCPELCYIFSLLQSRPFVG